MTIYSNRCSYLIWKRFMVLLGLVIAMLGTPAYAAITATVSGITVDKSSVALGSKVVFSAQVITNQSFSGSFQYNLRHRDTAQDFQVSSKVVKFVGGISSTQQVSFLLPTSLPEGAYDLTGRVYFNNPWSQVGGTSRSATVTSGVFSVASTSALLWKDEFNTNLNAWSDHEPWFTAPGHSDNNDAVWFPIPAGNLAALSKGQLHLRNRKCPNPVNAPMCGAELTTWQKSFKSFKHGRIDARVKIPGNADGFSAFWLLGNGTGDQSWPKSGEIDIFEFVNNGSDNGVPYFTVHWYGDMCNGGHCQKTYEWPAKLANYTTGFHIWSFTRTANEVKVSIDGKVWSRITRQDLAAIGGNYDVIFNEPMHLRVDLSSGGVWANDPSKDAEAGDLIFDYIRVWENN